MTEQIEFCDVIVLNKISSVSEDEKQRIYRIIRGLQPKTQIIETDFGKVPLKEIVMTGKFHQETAEESPLWVQELMNGGHHNHTPETDEYGIKSFIYRAYRPFHPERFLTLANTEWP